MPTALAPAVPPPLATPAAQARVRPPIVELPDSRVGRFARRLLDLVDGGDTATRRAFVEQPRMPALASLDDWQDYVDTRAIALADFGHGAAAEFVALRAAQEVS